MSKVVEEGQSNGSIGNMFGDGKISAAVTEHLAVVWLQVDGREIAVAADAFAAKRFQNLIPVFTSKLVFEADHVHEPTHPRFGTRRDHGRNGSQRLSVGFGHILPLLEDLAQSR